MQKESKQPQQEFAPSCPTPISEYRTVQMAHGGGGRLMHRLIQDVFLPSFSRLQKQQSPLHDSAVLELELDKSRLAFTTDSFVVSPLFFPGGDIGRLAVCGTINDLAMAAARPVALSAGFIIEEGLPIDVLRQVVSSMQHVAEEIGVPIVTGDTKVVDRGKGDGLYINTSGIGVIAPGTQVGPQWVEPNDVVIVSGDLGRHGMAIMSVREGLEFESPIRSDCAPLWPLVAELLQAGCKLHCLRDLTRGGLAAALNEIAEAANVGIELSEEAIPVDPAVAAACEMLGLDPLYSANEGTMVAFVTEESAELALTIMRNNPLGQTAAIIGRCTNEHPKLVELVNRYGGRRLLDLPAGEQMPRIC